MPSLTRAAPAWVEEARARATPTWAANAGAVVLLDEQTVTVVGSGKLVERRRRAIRVLNALAADQALCAASYLRGTREIRALDAWQVSPDGAVRRFGRKDALDLSEAGTW